MADDNLSVNPDDIRSPLDCSGQGSEGTPVPLGQGELESLLGGDARPTAEADVATSVPETAKTAAGPTATAQADDQDQIRPGDAFGQGRALEAAGPDQRHAVGQPQARPLTQRGKVAIARQAAKDRQIRRHAPAAAALVQRVEDVLDAPLFGDRVQRHAAQSDLRQRWRRCRSRRR